MTRRSGAALLALFALVLCLPQVYSQRRTRPSRRDTNPVRPQPVASPTPLPPSSEPRLVSTADEATQNETQRRAPGRTRPNTAPQADAEQEQLRTTVNTLNSQVERLSEDLRQMRSDQRALFDLERLSRAEQRAESLRAQLRDVTDKEFQYQERLAQIEDELQPDAIQRRAAVFGSLNPSALRDSIQRSLERERDRLRRQLDLVTNSRTRLEAAVATAETEVERLRQRVEAADQQEAGATTNATAAGTATATPTPQPSPTPTPAEPPE